MGTRATLSVYNDPHRAKQTFGGETYGTFESIIDYDGSTGAVFDTRGKCELAGYYCPPTWQLIRSCEASTALLDLGQELHQLSLERCIMSSPWDYSVIVDEFEPWATIGRFWPDRSHFVDLVTCCD
jgi:hypothetical protein